MCAGEGGAPLGKGCACPARPPSPSSQKYSWAETRSPGPPSGLLRGAGSLTPGSYPTLMAWAHPLLPQDRMQRRTQSQDGQAMESQSLGPRAWACTLTPALGQPHCPTTAARVAQGLVQPSVDTLLCSASASGLNTWGPSVFPCGFVSQLHDALGLSLLDKTPAS